MFRTIFLVAAIALLIPAGTHACSCVSPGSPEASLKNYRYVFLATVVDESQSEEFYNKSYHFKTNKAWKGDVDKTFVYNPPGHNCAYYGLKKGEDYLIYATSPWDEKSKEKMEISMCSRTKLANVAKLEMQLLDDVVEGKHARVTPSSLIETIKNGTNSHESSEAIRLISEHWQKENDGSLKAFIIAAKHGDVEVRKEAVSALGAYKYRGNKSAIQAVLPALKSSDRELVGNAASSLYSIGNRLPVAYQALTTVSLTAINRLKGKKSKVNQRLVNALVTSLAHNAEAKNHSELLDILIDSIPLLTDYEKVSPIQGVAFLRHAAKKAVPLLREELQGEAGKYFATRNALIDALGKTGGESEILTVMAYAGEHDCSTVKEVMQALNDIATPKSRSALKERVFPLVRKRFDECNSEFIYGLAELKGNAKELLPFLEKELARLAKQHWRYEPLKDTIRQIQNE